MSYLIAKIFVYLAVALVAGYGAGWMVRNFTASKKEDELQQQLSETKALVPQLESLMRSRDEQMQTLRKTVKEKDARIGGLHEEVGTQRQKNKTGPDGESGADVDQDLSAGTENDKIRRLVAEVQRLRQTAADHKRLAKTLTQEKRKVVELECERELQNKSLQVMHLQLDLARENAELKG